MIMIYDEQFFHGSTVHIATAQCETGDFLGYRTVPSWANSDYIAGDCALYTYATRSGADWKVAMEQVIYTSPRRSRIQVSFAWALWVDPRAQNIIVDLEVMHMFAWPFFKNFFAKPYKKTWDESYGVCHQLGRTWQLAVITTLPENDIAMAQSNGTVLPLSFVRNETGYFNWANRENATFFNWYVAGAPIRPTLTPAQDCVNADNNLQNQWLDVECRKQLFSRTVCENTVQNLFTGTISFLAVRENIKYNFTIPQPIDPSALPPDSTVILFGATINLPVQNCRQLDSYLYNVAHDKIYTAYHQDCMLQMAGNMDFTEYNKLVNSLEFLASDTTRWTSRPATSTSSRSSRPPRRGRWRRRAAR